MNENLDRETQEFREKIAEGLRHTRKNENIRRREAPRVIQLYRKILILSRMNFRCQCLGVLVVCDRASQETKKHDIAA